MKLPLHISPDLSLPLGTLGLIERRGGIVRPTALMFPEGLR